MFPIRFPVTRLLAASANQIGSSFTTANCWVKHPSRSFHTRTRDFSRLHFLFLLTNNNKVSPLLLAPCHSSMLMAKLLERICSNWCAIVRISSQWNSSQAFESQLCNMRSSEVCTILLCFQSHVLKYYSDQSTSIFFTWYHLWLIKCHWWRCQGRCNIIVAGCLRFFSLAPDDAAATSPELLHSWVTVSLRTHFTQPPCRGCLPTSIPFAVQEITCEMRTQIQVRCMDPTSPYHSALRGEIVTHFPSNYNFSSFSHWVALDALSIGNSCICTMHLHIPYIHPCIQWTTRCIPCIYHPTLFPTLFPMIYWKMLHSISVDSHLETHSLLNGENHHSSALLWPFRSDPEVTAHPCSGRSTTQTRSSATRMVPTAPRVKPFTTPIREVNDYPNNPYPSKMHCLHRFTSVTVPQFLSILLEVICHIPSLFTALPVDPGLWRPLLNPYFDGSNHLNTRNHAAAIPSRKATAVDDCASMAYCSIAVIDPQLSNVVEVGLWCWRRCIVPTNKQYLPVATKWMSNNMKQNQPFMLMLWDLGTNKDFSILTQHSIIRLIAPAKRLEFLFLYFLLTLQGSKCMQITPDAPTMWLPFLCLLWLCLWWQQRWIVDQLQTTNTISSMLPSRGECISYMMHFLEQISNNMPFYAIFTLDPNNTTDLNLRQYNSYRYLKSWPSCNSP